MGGTVEAPLSSDVEAPLPPGNNVSAPKMHAAGDNSITTDVTTLTRDTTSTCSTLSPSSPLRTPSPAFLAGESSCHSTSLEDRKETALNAKMKGTTSRRRDRKMILRRTRKAGTRFDEDLAESTIVATPGAVSVQGDANAESVTVMEDIVQEPGAINESMEEASAFVANARLVEEDENLEKRIQQAVESQLRKNHVVAEAVKMAPPADERGERKICGLAVWTFRTVVILIISLVLGGAAAGLVVALTNENPSVPTSSVVTSQNPTFAPSPSVSVKLLTEINGTKKILLQELQPWIIRTDQDGLPFQDPSSPQTRALNWLSADYITLTENRPTSTVLERYVLAVLYYSTDGPNWSRQDLNFLTDVDVCYWNNGIPSESIGMLGYYCEERPPTRLLNLFDTGLTGAMPWELSLLVDLVSLNLGTNTVTGTLPTEFGQILTLQYLNVYANELKGTVPTQFANCTDLKSLLVGDNGLTGTIPTELGLLTVLEALNICGNVLTGTVPTELGLLTATTYLGISVNLLTGTLPTELGQLTNLVTFFVDKMTLSGTLPTELARMTALQTWFVRQNSLTGTIPTQYGLLTALQLFYAETMMLSGTLPKEFANLTAITQLSLADNKLTGTLPPEWGQMTTLQKLWVDTNNLNGTLPTELGQLTDLTIFDFSVNSLSGTLLTERGHWVGLHLFNASNNMLNGTLPKEWKELTALTDLSINDNYLTGTVPTEFGKMTSLLTIHIENNAFTGTLPKELSDWSKVREFVFSGNNITGSVDDLLCSGAKGWVTLQGDCLATPDKESEIECQCCTICCNAGDECQGTEKMR